MHDRPRLRVVDEFADLLDCGKGLSVILLEHGPHQFAVSDISSVRRSRITWPYVFLVRFWSSHSAFVERNSVYVLSPTTRSTSPRSAFAIRSSPCSDPPGHRASLKVAS